MCVCYLLCSPCFLLSDNCGASSSVRGATSAWKPFLLVNPYTKEASQVQPQPEDTYCTVWGEAETLGKDIFNICGHRKICNALYTCIEGSGVIHMHEPLFKMRLLRKPRAEMKPSSWWKIVTLPVHKHQYKGSQVHNSHQRFLWSAHHSFPEHLQECLIRVLTQLICHLLFHSLHSGEYG